MLTDLKVSSLSCECLFHRPEDFANRGPPMELNFEGLEMQKGNMPTDKAQRENEKIGIIYLGIIFTPELTVIKMSKMAHILYLLLITAKNQSQFGQKFKCI